jgi:acetyl-CoA carboxylase carboxyltransferase component
VFGTELDKLKKKGQSPDSELETAMDNVRETYERDLDAKYAAARGFVDAVIGPEDTRAALELSLRTALNYSGPHLGQFVLPGVLS